MRLYNNVEIPDIGLGPGGMGYMPNTSGIRHKPNVFYRVYNHFIGSKVHRAEYVNAIANGIRAGFRLIDYSTSYGNGCLIADAIEESRVARKNVFLTGRISNGVQFRGTAAVREKIMQLLEE